MQSKSKIRVPVEEPEIILWGARDYMVVQTHFHFKPNFCWTWLGWFEVVLWLSWGFDNNNYVMAGGGVGSPSCLYAGTELW